MSHQYSSLSLGAIEGAPDILPEKDHALSKHPAETIRVYTARFLNEYVYGYQIIHKDGRNTFRNPSPAIGRFRTENDAILHCIGFFKHYREYLSPEAYQNIVAAERRFSQPIINFD